MFRVWRILWHKILSLLVCWGRPILKGILRRTTGLCELQRICYGKKPGAPRALAVERSLRSSRAEPIKAMVSHLDSIADNCRLYSETEHEIFCRTSHLVIRLKRINPRVHPAFVPNFEKCMRLVWGYKQLYRQVEKLRTTSYDSDVPYHEHKLLELWNLLQPHEPLQARITKQWQDIGFQGDDPKTDFRGMGLLGLENLLYFAKEFPGAASHVLSHSNHPKYGYTFAVVGINLTSMAYNLLKDGSAKTYVFNVSKQLPPIQIFHRFYCYLFYEFDRFWIESKPQNMMEFTYIQKKFEKTIRGLLKNEDNTFRINIKVDHV